MKKVRFMVGLLCIVGLTVLGCGSSENAQQQGTVTTVQKGAVSPINLNSPLTLQVIRNDVEWAAFWDILYSFMTIKPNLPPVNFSENVAIALVDSARASGGYSIEITRIQLTASGISVHAIQGSPGQGCGVTHAFSQPYHIVTTPIFTGTAVLNLTQSVSNCGP